MKKHTAAKAFSVAAIASAIALAPAAAFGYADEPGDDVVEVVIGEPTEIAFDADFIPEEPVVITLTGILASQQGLASAGTVDSQSIDKEADAEGNVSATVTLTETASGSYELTATGQLSGESATVVLNATPASTGGGTGGEDGLPATGMDTAALGLWVGGGALLLGGGAALVARSVRKQNSKA